GWVLARQGFHGYTRKDSPETNRARFGKSKTCGNTCGLLPFSFDFATDAWNPRAVLLKHSEAQSPNLSWSIV
ncbi:hypothetical protein D0868_03185, partial [Hortaea werneckii]